MWVNNETMQDKKISLEDAVQAVKHAQEKKCEIRINKGRLLGGKVDLNRKDPAYVLDLLETVFALDPTRYDFEGKHGVQRDYDGFAHELDLTLKSTLNNTEACYLKLNYFINDPLPPGEPLSEKAIRAWGYVANKSFDAAELAAETKPVKGFIKTLIAVFSGIFGYRKK